MNSLRSMILPWKVLILVVAAILFWIGLRSWAFTALAGFSARCGLILAGTLVSASVAWVLIMIRELRNALDLPDDCAAEGHLFPNLGEFDSPESTFIPTPFTSSDRNSYENWSTQDTATPRERPLPNPVTVRRRKTSRTPSMEPHFRNPNRR
jgi:hypothetical protein